MAYGMRLFLMVPLCLRLRSFCARRAFSCCACLLAIFFAGLHAETETEAAEGLKPVSFQSVIDTARRLAERDYQLPASPVPDFLRQMGYDDWRDIRFRPEKAVWLQEGLPFTIQFFHPGLPFYDRPVKINVVDSEGTRPVVFSPDLFDYGKNDFKDRIAGDLGFAGFRIHYPINTPDYRDEVAVFLGGTYLRAVARKQSYGLSARALALDTALPKGEEFPYFKEFWILRPSPKDREIGLYALVESPSITGAFRFVIQPGDVTVIPVTGHLFLRNSVDKLCIAPLTSMFFYGENSLRRPEDDFRPEVHDSDGLLVATGEGEWIWRPLSNPRHLRVTSFQTENPAGFGLIQRDTVFDHYQDLEARYETRPSVWVSPLDRWGKGRIELVQIPSDSEYNDNIVAYWVPAAPARPGQPVRLSYKMLWHTPDGTRPPLGRVTATRFARGKKPGTWSILIDFEGSRLEQFPADKPLTAVVTVDPRTRLLEQQLFKNSVTKGWRLVFLIEMDDTGHMERLLPPQKKPPYELRVFLKLNDMPLTETWSYPFQPELTDP